MSDRLREAVDALIEHVTHADCDGLCKYIRAVRAALDAPGADMGQGEPSLPKAGVLKLLEQMQAEREAIAEEAETLASRYDDEGKPGWRAFAKRVLDGDFAPARPRGEGGVCPQCPHCERVLKAPPDPPRCDYSCHRCADPHSPCSICGGGCHHSLEERHDAAARLR
jgi:hypothetical protein